MKDELEAICFNCNHFFPYTMNEPTEFGICLNDSAFDPFIEEILEDPDTAPCRQLIRDKKLSGEYSGCDNFEEIEERIEIDDDSSLGQALSKLVEKGNLDTESFKRAVLKEKLDNLDLKTLPVEQYMADLYSSDLKKQQETISSFGALISSGNQQAFEKLFEFFKELPPPVTISEVRFKIEILRNLEYTESNNILIPVLINELYQTVANNTTRQWISAIFKFLESCSKEDIHAHLTSMLKDKRFSYRLKQKMKKILNQ